MRFYSLFFAACVLVIQAMPAEVHNFRQFNIFEGSKLAKSSLPSDGVVVTSVVANKDRIFVLAAPRARQANQSWLISVRHDGSELREVMLPFANTQVPSLGSDGSILLLSTDTLAPRQVVIRVDPSGIAQTLGETASYARSVWQEGDEYRVYTSDGRILGQDSSGHFRKVVHTSPRHTDGPASCSACVTPEVVRFLAKTGIVRVNRESAEVARLIQGGAWMPVPLSHPWIDEGRQDYDRLRASARAAMPDVPGAGKGFALIVDAAANQNGELVMLVGPHDRLRPFRILVSSSGLQAWASLSAPTMGKDDAFSPVFVNLVTNDSVALADRSGNIRVYAQVRREVSE
jgi:hypothetical protein